MGSGISVVATCCGSALARVLSSPLSFWHSLLFLKNSAVQLYQVVEVPAYRPQCLLQGTQPRKGMSAVVENSGRFTRVAGYRAEDYPSKFLAVKKDLPESLEHFSFPLAFHLDHSLGFSSNGWEPNSLKLLGRQFSYYLQHNRKPELADIS